MKKNIEIGIFIILLISIAFSLIFCSLTEYAVGAKFYIGFGSVLIALLLRFKYVKFSKYVLVLALIAGSFNIIYFSHYGYGFSITLFGINFPEINPFVLFLLLILLAVNRDIMEVKGKPALNTSNKIANSEPSKELIDMYYKSLSTKSIEELQKMTNSENVYTVEAIIAANRLIEEKSILE